MAPDRPPGRKQDGPRRDRLTAEPPPNDTDTASVAAGWLRRRQATAAQMRTLPCGCHDPLVCDLARWCPFYDGPRPRPGLAVAADHLDGVGLCVCWAVPRRHREAS